MDMISFLKKLFGRKNNGPARIGVVVSTHEAKPMPDPTDTCAVVDVSGPEVDYECGHRHPERFMIDLYGMKIGLNEEGLAERKLCANCHLVKLKSATIRCAKCGFVIMPGDGVALYCYDRKLFKKTGWITFVGEGREKSVIGCLRWDCCPSGGFFAGHWTGDQFQSAFAGGSAAAEAMRTGQVVVSNIGGNDE